LACLGPDHCGFPPFAWTIDAIFLATFVLWYVASNVAGPGRRLVNFRIAAATILLLLLLSLSALEFIHCRLPVIAAPVSGHVVVLGDSISSGIGSRQPPWPAVFQQMTGVSVRNLARPGAGVAEGRSMAAQVLPEDRVVLIEIGGTTFSLACRPASSAGPSKRFFQLWRRRDGRLSCSNCRCCPT
jgi:hypothetical protein